MDKLKRYREIVIKVIEKHARYKPSHGQIESLSITDVQADNYLLMDTGWDKTGRVHAVVLHLRIVYVREACAERIQIWVEWDGIEMGIIEDLLNLGVAKEDIVLGFIRPEFRQFIDFSHV